MTYDPSSATAPTVDLAPSDDTDSVLSAIAQTVGVIEESPGRSLIEDLQEHIGDRTMLLVLDNFERVMAAAPAVTAPCATAPV